MKKIISIILAIVVMLSLCEAVFAVDALENGICFTWAWGANKIDTDNSVTVVSWSGGSNSSFRSGFIVYDLPENFKYTTEKSEVILSFAINGATLNNGTGQAPTAAVVMVDGDKVKKAYEMKSGSNATSLLKDAKTNGVVLGNYKIGKYPRTSRIKNANVNEFFEKNPGVKSIGFYVTNLSSDGYSGTVDGIASAMTDFEVNFTYYGNYKNVRVDMVDDKGNVLASEVKRGSCQTLIDVPEKIEKDGIIWVRDEKSYRFEEDVDVITVVYEDDKKDHEKYVAVIEEIVTKRAGNPLSEKLELPTEYCADDGFVIEIEWFSSDESVITPDGTVYCGTEVQTARIYAKMKLGKYTYANTEEITVTVLPIDENETDESLVYLNGFDDETDKRGSFCGEKTAIDITMPSEYTISVFVRVDDLEAGGEIFDLGGIKCEIENGSVFGKKITEGKWYHIALTSSAVYIDGEKVCDNELEIKSEACNFGGYWGKADNLKIFEKAFSKSVVDNLREEKYNSPTTETVSARVVKGLDSVIVRVASNGYEGDCTVLVMSEKDGVTHSAYEKKTIEDGVCVFSVTVPNMGGELCEDNTKILIWDSVTTINPLGEKSSADKKYDFGFDYDNPDGHMLQNTFTLKDVTRDLYLTYNSLSQRTDGAYWIAEYVNGVNKEGYYTLKNKDGRNFEGNFVFERVENNVYKIRNADSGEYVNCGGCEKWELSICEYADAARIFASEGFFLLSEEKREALYGATGQAMYQSRARYGRLCETISNGYFEADAQAQKQMLEEVMEYYPSYQINGAVNAITTGCEARYTLSEIKAASYKDMDNATRSGYTAKVVYEYVEGNVEVEIYARSKNVVKNIAKGFCYMPYQFIKPLTRVTDYYATNNQFKAETGEIFIETNYEVSSENVAVTGAHELGHLIDFALFRLSVGDYRTARDNECAVSGYAETALGEDFAEFCQAVISSYGNKEKLRQLKKMFPGRYAALCEGMCSYYGKCILAD